MYPITVILALSELQYRLCDRHEYSVVRCREGIFSNGNGKEDNLTWFNCLDITSQFGQDGVACS